MVGMLFPLYLAGVLLAVVPYLARRSLDQQLKAVPTLGGIVLPEFALLLWSQVTSHSVLDRTVGFVLFGPPIVTTTVAGYWYLRRWKSALIQPGNLSESSRGKIPQQ